MMSFAVDGRDDQGHEVGDQQLQDVASEDVEAAQIGVLVGDSCVDRALAQLDVDVRHSRRLETELLYRDRADAGLRSASVAQHRNVAPLATNLDDHQHDQAVGEEVPPLRN